MKRKEVLKRVEKLIAEHSTVNLSDLPLLYSKKFGEKLDTKEKLKKLIDEIPSVNVKKKSGIFFATNLTSQKNNKTKNKKGTENPKTRKDQKTLEKNSLNEKTETNSTGEILVKKKNKKKSEIIEEDATASIITYEQAILKQVLPTSGTEKIDITNIDGLAQSSTIDLFFEKFFAPTVKKSQINKCQKSSICDREHFSMLKSGSLLGHLNYNRDSLENDDEQKSGEVYMNTNEPFCAVIVGVQGAGKSHTLSCVLESCLLSLETNNVIKLEKPMVVLVLHYDQNVTSICEATGLLAPDAEVERFCERTGSIPPYVPMEKAVVLVSPSFYKQRKKFYGSHCHVCPLLFKWKSLTADHIKRIMRIEQGGNQLYVASFMNLLRKYQRKAVVPEFESFIEEVRSTCSCSGQSGPLDQRIALLESMIAEAEINEDIRGESLDIDKVCKSGYNLIVADLTDPLLSREEVNSLFQVLTEQFRAMHVEEGKVLALDEAHKYMDGDNDGLSEAIVNVARLMRHDGMRLIVSTQSPKALAPELLELVTVGVLHNFHSNDWWSYLEKKLPLSNSDVGSILTLDSGNALIFGSKNFFRAQCHEGEHIFPIRIRKRLTADRGESKRNT